jgi:hypothetical protein
MNREHQVDEPYDKLRSMITDLVDFMEMPQTEICATLDWLPSSLVRFMKGEHKTMAYAQGKALERLYAEHEETIRTRKRAKAKAILESLGTPANG